jgi:hypothetical protein
MGKVDAGLRQESETVADACPESYISRAAWSLWAVITDGRPP